MKNRKLLVEQVESFGIYDLFDSESPQNVVSFISNPISKYEQKEIFFRVEDDGAFDIVAVYEERLENDEEYDARLKKEAKRKENEKKTEQKTLESERKEYERLKRKFEKD